MINKGPSMYRTLLPNNVDSECSRAARLELRKWWLRASSGGRTLTHNSFVSWRSGRVNAKDSIISNPPPFLPSIEALITAPNISQSQRMDGHLIFQRNAAVCWRRLTTWWGAAGGKTRSVGHVTGPSRIAASRSLHSHSPAARCDES